MTTQHGDNPRQSHKRNTEETGHGPAGTVDLSELASLRISPRPEPQVAPRIDTIRHTIGDRSYTAVLQHSDEMLRLTFLKPPVTVEFKADLDDNQWNWVRKFAGERSMNFTLHHTDSKGDLESAVRYAKLHDAVFKPNASPLEAAEQLRDLVFRKLKSGVGTDWPMPYITLGANQKSSKERFEATLKSLSSLGDLYQETTNLSYRHGDRGAEEILGQAINDHRQRRFDQMGSQVIDRLLRGNEPRPVSLDDVVAESNAQMEQERRKRVAPAEIGLTVTREGYQHYKASILIEQSSAAGQALRIIYQDEDAHRTGTTAKNLRHLLDMMSKASEKEYPRARWDFRHTQVDSQPLAK